MGFFHLQSSFNGGQISRRLHGRTDLGIHGVAVAEMTNMIATLEGAAIKRPGTIYRAAALSSAARLTPFIFNATQAYVLEWGDYTLRSLTNNALVPSNEAPATIVTPYAAEDVDRIAYEQSGDVLYLAHANYQQHELRRTGATTFELEELDLAGGPFADVNGDTTARLVASGSLLEGGTCTLTATKAVFAAGQAGSPIRIEAEDFGEVKAWQEGIDGIAIGDLRRSEGRVYQALTAGRTGYNQPIHSRGDEWDGDATGQDVNENGPYGVKWRYLHDRFGILQIETVNSATSVTGKVQRRLPETLTSTSSHRWAPALFSAAAGWPEHVCLWRGRLWWFKGFDLAGSVSGDYRNHNEYDEDGSRQPDMAIRRTLDLTDRILWVRADRQAMILGTARGEWAIGPINPSEPISSDNLQLTRQRRHGSEKVWPAEAGGEIFFVQRGGRKIRASSYAFADDRYSARWANLYARHATSSKVKELTYQAEPEELLWALRRDGTAAVHPYSPEQEVKGWSTGLKMAGATVLSFCSIPAPDGGNDDLWLLVDRDGARSHEQLADWWNDEEGGNPADAYFLDSGGTYEGDPATQFSGAEHLAGLTVGVLADGKQYEALVNEDGTFFLNTPASKVHYGVRFTARLELLEPEISMRDGTSMGRLRRTIDVFAYVIDSIAPRVGTKAKGKLERLLSWVVGRGAIAETNPPFTGWSGPKIAGGDMDRNDRLVLEDDSAFPWILPAVVREIEVGAK